MRKPCIRDKHGFTLVELALVLVIVGLLITGVLKGEALIENAKVKKLVNQKDSIAAAYYTYFDRYGMLPGACRTGQSRYSTLLRWNLSDSRAF